MAFQTRVVDAKTGFDGTHVEMRSEYRDHTISIADYTCPECRSVVRFNSNDLRRETFSVLSVEQLDAIEQARPRNSHLWECALDFHCPNWGITVRVIAQPGDEYGMGAHDWDFATVVEYVAEPLAPPGPGSPIV